MQANRFLVQGWQIFDQSGHGENTRVNTVEWDGQPETWKAVEKEILNQYDGLNGSEGPQFFELNRIFDDMIQAMIKITKYARDFYEALQASDQQIHRGLMRTQSAQNCTVHYAKHCRRWNALVNFVQVQRSFIWELANKMAADPKRPDTTLLEHIQVMEADQWGLMQESPVVSNDQVQFLEDNIVNKYYNAKMRRAGTHGEFTDAHKQMAAESGNPYLVL